MAIAAILGIVFGLLFIGALVLCGFMFYKNSDEGGGCIGFVTTGVVSIIAAAGLFFCFLFVPFSYHQVDAGEVAVVKHLGEVRDVRTAGTYFDFWVTEKYEKYDAKVQNVNINTSAYSNDAQTMDVSMTVQYQIDTSHVKDIANVYGSLDVLNNRIESVAIDAMKSVMADHKANEIIKDRASVSPKVTEAVKGVIDGSYYVSVNTVVLTNIDFTDAYEAAVEAEMIAEREKNAAETKAKQEAEVAKIQAEAQIKIAEAELEAAKIKAQTALTIAEGDANVQKTIALAEAVSTTSKIAKIAESLGNEVEEIHAFEVCVETKQLPKLDENGVQMKDEDGNLIYENVEVTVVDENGKEVLKETDKVIGYSITWKNEESKTLVLDYLKYLEYLTTWNGELPEVVAGDNGFMITVPTTSPKGE